jgi:DnaJ-class molecular chaperone
MGGGEEPFSADDIIGEIFGGMGRGARSRARPTPVAGEDVIATAAVTLEQLVHGDKVRVDLPTGRTLDVAVPAGTRSGQTIRLRGQGRPGMLGGAAGDALVTIELVPHPVYRLEGENLRRDVAIGLDEAVLGGKVRVDTLDGPVTLTVPANSTGGGSLRLKGKGLPRAGGGRGDLLVALRIVLPEGGDKDLDTLMRTWRDEKRHAARKDDQAV